MAINIIIYFILFILIVSPSKILAQISYDVESRKLDKSYQFFKTKLSDSLESDAEFDFSNIDYVRDEISSPYEGNHYTIPPKPLNISLKEDYTNLTSSFHTIRYNEIHLRLNLGLNFSTNFSTSFENKTNMESPFIDYSKNNLAYNINNEESLLKRFNEILKENPNWIKQDDKGQDVSREIEFKTPDYVKFSKTKREYLDELKFEGIDNKNKEEMLDKLYERNSDLKIAKHNITTNSANFNYNERYKSPDISNLYYQNKSLMSRIEKLERPNLNYDAMNLSPAVSRGVYSLLERQLYGNVIKHSKSIFIDSQFGGFMNYTMSVSSAIGYNDGGDTYAIYLEQSQWLDVKTNTGKLIKSIGLELCPDLSFGLELVQFKPCYKYVSGDGYFKERDAIGDIRANKLKRDSIRLYGRWILSVPEDFGKYLRQGLTRDNVYGELEGYSGFSDDPFLWGWFGGLTIRTPISGVSFSIENYMGQRIVIGAGYLYGRVL